MNKLRVLVIFLIVILLATMPANARPASSGSQSYTGDALLAWAGYPSSFSHDCAFYWNGSIHSIGFTGGTDCYAPFHMRMVLYTPSAQSWDYNAATITFTVDVHPDSCALYPTPPDLTGDVFLVDGSFNEISSPSSGGFPVSTTFVNSGSGLGAFFLVIDFLCDQDAVSYVNSIQVSWNDATATPPPTNTPAPTLPPFSASISDIGTTGQDTLNAYAPAIGIIFGLFLGLFAIAFFTMWIRRAIS